MMAFREEVGVTHQYIAMYAYDFSRHGSIFVLSTLAEFPLRKRLWEDDGVLEAGGGSRLERMNAKFAYDLLPACLHRRAYTLQFSSCVYMRTHCLILAWEGYEA